MVRMVSSFQLPGLIECGMLVKRKTVELGFCLARPAGAMERYVSPLQRVSQGNSLMVYREQPHRSRLGCFCTQKVDKVDQNVADPTVKSYCGFPIDCSSLKLNLSCEVYTSRSPLVSNANEVCVIPVEPPWQHFSQWQSRIQRIRYHC